MNPRVGLGANQFFMIFMQMVNFGHVPKDLTHSPLSRT